MARNHTRRPRTDRAYTYATPAELERVTWTVPVQESCIGADARSIVDDLPIRAQRVLRLFLALHRLGRIGYRGTAAIYDQVAHAVRLSTRERCGLRTLKYALDELESAGLITRTPWAPDPHDVIEIAPGQWRTVTIRIISLTPEAIALWSRPPRRCAAAVPDPDARPDGAEIDGAGVVDLEVQKVHEAERLTPPSPRRCSAGGETERACTRPHDIISSNDRDAVGPTPAPSISAPSGRASGSGTAAAHQRAAGAVGHHTSSATRAPGSSEGRTGAKRGPTVAPPPRPDRRAPRTPGNARLVLLADLFTFLRPFPSRDADALFARARRETRRDWPESWPTCTDWGYWLHRWRGLPRRERMGHIRASILASLRSAVITPPASPAIARSSTSTTVATSSSSSTSPAPEFETWIGDPDLAAGARAHYERLAAEETDPRRRRKLIALALGIRVGSPPDREIAE